MNTTKKKRSRFWLHFTEIDLNSSGRRSAKCNHCDTVIAYGTNTSNFGRHMHSKHPDIQIYKEHYNENPLEHQNGNPLESDTELEYVTENGDKFKKVIVMAESPNQSETDMLGEDEDEKKYKDKIDKNVSHNTPKKIRDKINRKENKITTEYLKFRKRRSPSYHRETFESSPKSYDTKTEDRFDIFGRLVAMKMKVLADSQKLLAEKLINDVMYEAESGNLTKYCCLTVQEIQVHLLQDNDSRECAKVE